MYSLTWEHLDYNLGVAGPQTSKSSPAPHAQTCSAAMNKTLLGHLQPREVSGSKLLAGSGFAPGVSFQQGPTGDGAAYPDGIFPGLLLKLS